LWRIGKLGEAELVLRRAVAIRESTLGPGHGYTASSLSNLGLVLQDLSRTEEAAACYQAAIQSYESAGMGESSGLSSALSNLGTIFFRTGRLSEAETLLRRALAIKESALGQDHPEVATTMGNLSSVLQRLNRYAESEGLIRKALEIFRKSEGSHRISIENYLSALGDILESEGRLEDAVKVYTEVADLRGNRLGINHPRTVAARKAAERLTRATH
jgi:tetratricopeptide (TPR) repeat protein